MERDSADLQFMIREHLLEQGQHREHTHGTIEPGKLLNVRWNSQMGCVFVDGSHLRHDLQLGDEIMIDNNAPMLKILEPAELVDL